jgi:hypothetical protein
MMNEIVHVIDKPNLIDVLLSEGAREARRLSGDLNSSSLNALATAISTAELMVETPEFKALVGVLKAALKRASVADIGRELAIVYACYPGKHIDVSVLVACAVDEVVREQPTLLRLLFAGRRIRRKCKFRPTIAEIVKALEHAFSAVRKAREIVELPKRLADAAPRLQASVKDELRRVSELLADRKLLLSTGKTVRWNDDRLKDERGKLADVLALRVAALEPLRPLIIQSISMTESEKATTKNRTAVEVEESIPW